MENQLPKYKTIRSKKLKILDQDFQKGLIDSPELYKKLIKLNDLYFDFFVTSQSCIGHRDKEPYLSIIINIDKVIEIFDILKIVMGALDIASITINITFDIGIPRIVIWCHKISLFKLIDMLYEIKQKIN